MRGERAREDKPSTLHAAGSPRGSDAADIDSAELDARLCWSAPRSTSISPVSSPQRAESSRRDESNRLEAFAARRVNGEPVARILGQKEFWGLPLQLSTATLVPRPDTETVVELALEIIRAAPPRALRIADLGAGSGAILLALLHELPAALGVGTDISLRRSEPRGATPPISGLLRARPSSPAITPRRLRARSI